ncbi:class I SAM-dependent methyltransferase [Arthrobacter sp. NIO-1057]|uniref:class I SAM-dependent methyltransferase n=1 Tax=Arthrobacter sp. NIO-1057 TaxID=993071 RepID=UPI00071E395A|nr:class I SAM-dependent methyltransferase [Arthrobacter sp. NIO-1057]KSU63081.1 ubiquinone biosynthesis methyltransferase UbiE [Arthrobacter sp. NIO-1057]SCC53318.1 demethylmenaquinone methyltransferase / 2-methoxy-6-polyprenyl-1,4-benzoquinol methylase [Arthrobacter sp. NIO-1057]
MSSHNARAGLDKKADQVQDMFDKLAPRYDLLNTLMTGGIVNYWRKITTEAIAPKPGERILDLAAGTGSSSVPLAEAGAKVTACDMSHGMLAEGRKRYPQLDFVYGDAHELPFEDDTFDAVTISYGLRNIDDTEKALSELRRVTKPGGRIVVAEFSTPTVTPIKVAYQQFLPRAIPALGYLVSPNPSAYAYLAESIAAWPNQEDLGAKFVNVGWKNVEYRNLTGGIVAVHRAWK